jgi:Flp pilus assembly protein CpaB
MTRRHPFPFPRPLPPRLLVWFSGWPRLVLAAALLVTAGITEALSLRHDAGPAPPPPPPHTRVVVAARDLPGGTAVRAGDLRLVDLPPQAVPAHALTSPDAAAGRRVAVPLRRGEVLTDVRLVGPSLAAAVGGAGSRAVPLRLGDAATAALLRPGDHVDVVSVPEASQDGTPAEPAVLAADLTVLAVPTLPDDQLGGTVPMVVVAAPARTAPRLAAAGREELAAVLRPP